MKGLKTSFALNGNKNREKEMKNVILILNKYFSRNKRFETVEQKAKRLVKDKLVPEYIKDYYGVNK